jgi:hypothetical protein
MWVASSSKMASHGPRDTIPRPGLCRPGP